MDGSQGFQDAIQAQRALHGWSLREAAKRISDKGLPLSHVLLGDYERGVTHTSGRPAHPPREVVINIAKAYSMPVDDLLIRAGYLPMNFQRELTTEEAALLEFFRELSSDHQGMVLRVVQALRADPAIKADSRQ